MTKQRHKKTFFDALKEKKADPQVISICRFFAKTRHFFTSSTCSGRIVLLNVNEKESKKEAAFHSKWHRKITTKELARELEKPSENELWFKMEPFIMHIGTDSIENSKKLLRATRECGIKRGGIQVLKEGKIIFEITGTQYISCPAKKNDEILLDKKYLGLLVKKANQKISKNYELLKKFEKECKRTLA